MKFDDLFEATMKKFSDDGIAENLAYEIAYKVKPVKMPLIKTESPSTAANAWWEYDDKEGQSRTATLSIKKYRNDICVALYIGDKGSNRGYDEANDFPYTYKKWSFKVSSKEGQLDEIGNYISKAIRADMKGKTIREKG